MISVSILCRSISSKVRTGRTFKHFDIAKGWPVSTGPWQVTNASLQQKVFDRRATLVGG